MMKLSGYSRCPVGEKPTSRKDVLWVSTSLATRGGIATFVRNMQQTALWREWNIRHVATHCNGSAFKRLGKFFLGLAHFLFELVFRRPSIVHIHTSSDGSFARKCVLTWLSVTFRIPVVLHVHGSGFHEFFDGAPTVVKLLIRATLERAKTVVALGDTWASRLRIIAPQAKIIVVPNAIRPTTVVEQSPTGAVHVVFLGEVSVRKGAFLLLDAWAKLVGRTPSTLSTLTIAGDGEVGRARDRAASLAIGANVDIRGWLSETDVGQLLATAHVLVLPSLNEGQPMAILEAMAKGICVVASRSGGIPEMLAEGAGLLVDPLNSDSLADALEYVTANYEVRCEFGARAHRRVQENFDVDQVSLKFDELYNALSITNERFIR